MSEMIRLILSNIPALSFVLAILLAATRQDGRTFAARLLDWMLLLPVGLTFLWAGLFHVFAPQVAAASIGWQVSPFQFEIGVADIAIGIVGIASFWRSIGFKSAVVAYIVLFDIGVAIGHVRQAVMQGDYAANNFGLLLGLTVIQALLLPALLWFVARSTQPAPTHAIVDRI